MDQQNSTNFLIGNSPSTYAPCPVRVEMQMAKLISKLPDSKDILQYFSFEIDFWQKLLKCCKIFYNH